MDLMMTAEMAFWAYGLAPEPAVEPEPAVVMIQERRTPCYEDIPDCPTRAWKYACIADIPVGQRLLITWAEIGDMLDGPACVRSAAWYHGRLLGRRYRTKRGIHGIYVMRDS
jgi:hypothetical protein